MFTTLKKMLGIAPSVNYKELIGKGAKIIDVRTKAEYAAGHIKNSINIPLNELSSGIKQLKKDTIIITCCASGIRSASAKGVLKQMGFEKVYNGGGWTSLQRKL